MRDIKIKDVPLVESLTGQEKIPVSDGSGSPKAITVLLILDKTSTSDLSEYVKHSDLLLEHEYVDLGLPSGTLWATCNVGANSPEEYGNLYAWGETETKETYTKSNSVTYNLSVEELKQLGIINSNNNLMPNYDAATVNWGKNWRTPTLEEIRELFTACTKYMQPDTREFIFTGPNGNSITLPFRADFSIYCCYWSSTANPNNTMACTLELFDDGSCNEFTETRYNGFLIRPVCVEPSILDNYYTKEEIENNYYTKEEIYNKEEIDDKNYVTDAPSDGLYVRQKGSWVKLDEKDPIIDLSMLDIHGNYIKQTTANCYVVSKSGNYKFPLVYGNAIKNGETNTSAYTKVEGDNSHDFVNHLDNVITSPYIYENEGCVPSSVELTISDEANLFSSLELVNNYIQFSIDTIPATGANAVVSLLDPDKTVMWSWHIWVWPDDLTPVTITNDTGVDYDILPVNLGSKWDSDSKDKIKNWYYQWGRHVPMLCPSAYDSSEDHQSYGTQVFSVNYDTINEYRNCIQNPHTLFTELNNVVHFNFWDANCITEGCSDNTVVKTVYDPCPVGYHIPNGNTFNGFSEDDVVGSFANGWHFKKDYNDYDGVFFPASGLRYYQSILSVGSEGYVWLSACCSTDLRYALYFSSGCADYNYSAYSRESYSVRPVKEI